MTRRLLWTTACLAVALGCAPAGPAELSEDDLAAIRERFDQVARTLTPEDNEAWAQNFTEDAVFMFQHTPMVRGRAAIQEWGETDSPVVLEASFSDIEIDGSGDWAWATSSTEATFEGMDQPDRGKQLTVFERQPDGAWLVAAVHVSSDLPLPEN